jgi:hypothetical protein
MVCVSAGCRPTKGSSSFPFPFVPLQCRGCLVVPLFLWIVLVALRQGWRVKGWVWPSEQPRSAKANSWLAYQMVVYSSLWDLKSSFICRKFLRRVTFPLYIPSQRKVCCGFLSPLKIHRHGRVLNPQPFVSSSQHTNHYTTKATRLRDRGQLIPQDTILQWGGSRWFPRDPTVSTSWWTDIFKQVWT